ncbi:FUSC family protein [Candidatus Methylospira mobilis]|uniref:FUSC family protein n=1 Tax=Candidatus Methylospira mobilis TaxID=1808979 RepID=A0A5Q0BI24_9GAMM|nr:FUSC family protein [Candidatus Methylospira mobilis]QFY41476.1 FUSC family protein [Candidatus Methylospira mobilis]WNV05296.1 FUSC family protein [Candidatus Methylospira mobilis]
MNPANTVHTSTESRGRSNLWFGTTLAQFLLAELRYFPGRRLATLRLFFVVLTIAIVSQSLHMPPLAAIAITLSLGYSPYANAGESLAFGLRQFGYVIITVAVSVFALAFAGNAPWLFLPLSLMIIALSLFHARLIAWPTGIAIWYGAAVLYSPTTPDADIYRALWFLPVMGGLAIGIWTLVQLTVKPQDPLKLLTLSLAGQLSSVEAILASRLTGGSLNAHERPYGKPGTFGKVHNLLTDAELIHPSLNRQRGIYVALLVEIDGLHRIAVWLDQVLTEERRNKPMSRQKLETYLALQSACAILRQGVTEGRDVSAQAWALLPDEALPAATLQTSPSLLTVLWRSLQRVAGLLHSLHDASALPESESADADNGDEDTGIPAWFGYSFWAMHVDSVQFGIKFSLGAILCTLIVESLNWPEIDTAILTCLIVAQTSLGADYRQAMLRVSGAALGGLSAYLYILLFQSQIETIAGFALTTAPVWAVAAWIAAGSVRIAYMGKQIGYSFALFVLHDFGPVTGLHLPRDRVIGIFLGIIVMGLLDYALWPRRSINLARNRSASALRTLAKLTARPQGQNLPLKRTLPLRLSAEKELAAAQDLLGHAVLEPDAGLADKMDERTAVSAIIEDAGNLSGMLLVRMSYRLLGGPQFNRFPDALREKSRAFDIELATALENAALALQGAQPETWSAVADTHELMRTSYYEHHGIETLPPDMALAWELRFELDRQIIKRVERIEKRATELATAG